jgi:FMN-dependent NADH-azoreductase
MKVLKVNSSVTGENSVSRILVEAVASKFDKTDILEVDLDATPLPHLNGRVLGARLAAAPDAALQAYEEADTAVQAYETALEQFLSADVVIIGAPMYNFGVPSQLKSWLDALAVAGKTFRYTESGAVGLCAGKRIIVASSRGGFYAPPSPVAGHDHQEAHLIAFFSVLGITDVEVVRAEGVNISPEQRERGIATAMEQVSGLQ